MMIRIFILVSLLIFAPAAYAAESVFRGMMWGAGKDDVKKFETALFDREADDVLYFFEKEGRKRVRVSYAFKDGKLWRGVREYRELHDPVSQAILEMSADTQIKMEKALGAPTSTEILWNDNEYEYYPQFWGRALRSGDLRIRVTWETPESRIRLETYYDGADYQITTTAEWKAVADAAQNEPYLLLQGANGSGR